MPITVAESITVAEEPLAALAAYARVPMRFEVQRVLDVTAPAGGLGGLVLTERALDVPYVKDYDVLDGGPLQWPERFNVARWGLLSAFEGSQRRGGATVVMATNEVEMLEGRDDLAVLWDLRVAPEARRRGVGQALFRAAEAWAQARGARWLKVETQNVNVPACRLYAAMGCTLGAVHRFAYPTVPHEAPLLWYKPLGLAA